MQNTSYLSVKDVAAQLGVSPSTILRLIQSKKLPALKVTAKLFRIASSDLDAYVAAQK